MTDPGIELPSDIRDVLHVNFNVSDPNPEGIEKTVTAWGIKWRKPDSAAAAL